MNSFLSCFFSFLLLYATAIKSQFQSLKRREFFFCFGHNKGNGGELLIKNNRKRNEIEIFNKLKGFLNNLF